MKILVLYGGVSSEHEVAIITAIQIMRALQGAGFEVVPGYISKEGEWFRGDERFLKPEFYKKLDTVKQVGRSLIVPANRNMGMMTKNWLGFGGSGEQIDVVFPVFHGRNGEDGTVQGLLELLNVPYVGCQVTASAVGMDKYLSKCVARSVGIRVVDDVLLTTDNWKNDRSKVVNQIADLGWPVFVKPVNLGSSIGIGVAKNVEELENAVEVAFCYDQRVLVEKGVEKVREVNISILGNGPYEVSMTEQPLNSGGILSFEDKYLKGGGKTAPKASHSGGQAGMASLSRVMPAPFGDKKIAEVEETARKFFSAIGGKGIARIDFMLDTDDNLYFNEINTLPGSFAFYLWDPPSHKALEGRGRYTFPQLVEKLVNLAVDDWKARQMLTYTFKSNILAGFAKNSMKGGKV